jgi:hypothetical protein
MFELISSIGGALARKVNCAGERWTAKLRINLDPAAERKRER